jgi:hypothetical protein
MPRHGHGFSGSAHSGGHLSNGGQPMGFRRRSISRGERVTLESLGIHCGRWFSSLKGLGTGIFFWGLKRTRDPQPNHVYEYAGAPAYLYNEENEKFLFECDWSQCCYGCFKSACPDPFPPFSEPQRLSKKPEKISLGPLYVTDQEIPQGMLVPIMPQENIPESPSEKAYPSQVTMSQGPAHKPFQIEMTGTMQSTLEPESTKSQPNEPTSSSIPISNSPSDAGFHPITPLESDKAGPQETPM